MYIFNNYFVYICIKNYIYKQFIKIIINYSSEVKNQKFNFILFLNVMWINYIYGLACFKILLPLIDFKTFLCLLLYYNLLIHRDFGNNVSIFEQ